MLEAIDVIKEILNASETRKAEPVGDCSELIGPLRALLAEGDAAVTSAVGEPVPDMPRAATGSGGWIAEETLRVHVEILGQLMNQVSELVLTRNQLEQWQAERAGDDRPGYREGPMPSSFNM